jgi:hypothetical protein
MRNSRELIQNMRSALDSKDHGRIEQAVSSFDSAFRKDPAIVAGNEQSLHLAASSYGFLENRKMALEYVRLADWNGYADFKEIWNDEHMELLRDNPDFKLMFGK